MDYFICITILAALAWLAGYVLIKLYGLITNVLFGYRDEDLTRSFTRKVVKAYLIVVLVSIGAVVWDRIEMGMDFETELKVAAVPVALLSLWLLRKLNISASAGDSWFKKMRKEEEEYFKERGWREECGEIIEG